MSYTELQVTTNFSFLRGGSHPEELVTQAADYGYRAIGITDRNTLAGIVRAHAAVKGRDIRVIVGCRLDLLDGPSLLAYPTDKDAYSRLSGLLTTGNLRAEKGMCHLYRSDVYQRLEGCLLVALPPDTLTASFEIEPDFIRAFSEYKEAFGGRLYLAGRRSYRGDDMKQLFRLAQLSTKLSVPLVATNDVHYHHPDRRQLQDVLTCIREKCTIHTAGFRLDQNAERHLKRIEEMERLFRQYPYALRRTQEIAEAAQFVLSQLQYVYPEEITSDGRTPQEELTHLAWQGAREHFGEQIPEKISSSILHELKFIGEMNYAPYFLTVYDIVRYARKAGILCQGRGSAANSTICYCLGITAVNPAKYDLLFERFISSARNEPPDIDVDFEHERREEVIQYIYNKYGRDRAAIVATVTQERRKGAIRDVGKAMGLSVDTIAQLGQSMEAPGFAPKDPHVIRVLDLTRQLIGFPRQLGQHTGGFVITNGPLSALCPILNARMEERTTIEWNKDDIDVLGILKIDVLALGMLTCIRKAFTLVSTHYDRHLTLANVPQDIPAVYEMISHADTLGVFQIESRAQMAMLPRLRPENFYDLVIEVSIVRPGPIQGDMVHPYLRRRRKEEAVEYPSQELKEILEKTLGVPLFQEQAMKIAIVAAGFTPAEADELRRAMATFKLPGVVDRFEQKLVNGMIAKGYTPEFAQRIFRQLEGFGSYGFPESHAASFALLVYVSAWLKCFYPDVFACALLNSMPMGFYQPAQIIIDARKNGVGVRPVDVNFSSWDNVLEERAGKYCALRLGFRQVKGVSEEDVEVLKEESGAMRGSAVKAAYDPSGAASAGADGDPLDVVADAVTSADSLRYHSIAELKDLGLSLRTLEKLADADAFRSMGLDRRSALWEVTALNDHPEALFAGQPGESHYEVGIALPLMSDGEQVIQDYAALSLSLKAHPVSFVRDTLVGLHVRSCSELQTLKDGDIVRLSGLVLVRQRPGTASGVVFITIEDETGFANVVVFKKLFDQYRSAILQSRLLMVEGKIQKEGEVIHVIARRFENYNRLLIALKSAHGELSAAGAPDREEKKAVQQARIFPDARNFK